MSDTLPVVEMFQSIQGESTLAGYPCAFVRTAGCNLNCNYCDTRYACEHKGQSMSLEQIIAKIGDIGCHKVCITGGEPLLHEEVALLCEELIAGGYRVILETNGTQDIAPIPNRVMTVMDIKCPSTGECGKTLWSNLKRLSGDDQLKFVVGNREDFEWAVQCREEHRDFWMRPILFAPMWGRLTGTELADWILDAGVEVRLQLQLHKILWPDATRGA